MLINFYCLLVGKFLVRNSRPKHLAWVSLRVNIGSSEGRLTWHIWGMIIWMRQGHCVGAVSSGSGIESIINFGNVNGVKPLKIMN